MEPNWANIVKLRNYIASLPPENVQMHKLLNINKDSETVAEARQPECGSVGCIKGLAFLLFGEDSNILHRTDGDKERMLNCDYNRIGTVSIDYTVSSALGTSSTGGREENHMFLAYWHPRKVWQESEITRDEVIGYLDKALNAKNLLVILDATDLERINNVPPIH